MDVAIAPASDSENGPDALIGMIAGIEAWRQERRCIPALDPARSVRVATSDGSGAVTFSGLTPDRYFVRTRHAHKVLLTIRGHRDPEIPGVPAGVNVSLVMRDVVAAAVRPASGEEMVFFSSTRKRNDFEPLYGELGPIRSELRARFPGSRILVGVPGPGLREDGVLPVVHAEFLLSKSGWIRHRIELRPVAAGVPVIETGGLERAQSACVRRTFKAIPALGVPNGFPAPRFILAGEYRDRDVELVVRLNEPTWIPPGRYRIRAMFGFVDAAFDLPDSIVIQRGAPTDISLTRLSDLVPCRLSFSAPYGMHVPRLSEMGIVQPGGAWQAWRVWDKRDAEIMESLSPEQWVAPGTIEVHATAGRLGRTIQIFDVQPSSTVRVLHVSLGS